MGESELFTSMEIIIILRLLGTERHCIPFACLNDFRSSLLFTQFIESGEKRRAERERGATAETAAVLLIRILLMMCYQHCYRDTRTDQLINYLFRGKVVWLAFG